MLEIIKAIPEGKQIETEIFEFSLEDENYENYLKQQERIENEEMLYFALRTSEEEKYNTLLKLQSIAEKRWEFKGHKTFCFGIEKTESQKGKTPLNKIKWEEK